MTISRNRFNNSIVGGLILVPLILVLAWWVLESKDTWPRGEALEHALKPVIAEEITDQAVVASAILTNYKEIRSNASRWSGVYWGCTFVAAFFSALAGLILKLESIPLAEKPKKDISATLAVTAAILVTISTSGDFQRKWQANRIAAAELESAGYEFLASGRNDPLSYHTVIGETLRQRHMAIVGGKDRENSAR